MLEDYLVFARIVEGGSLSAAARAMRVSISKISKRLAALEHRLGVTLIQRSTRRVIVTNAGEQLYNHISRVLNTLEDAEAVVRGRVGTLAGRLRITTSNVVGRNVISPLLPSFARKFPMVRMQLDLDDDFKNLSDGYYDLAIRMSGPREERFDHHPLSKNRRILCCSLSYVAERGVPRTFEDLQNHDLLGAASQFPWRLEGPEGEFTIHGSSAVTTNSTEVVRDLLLGGLGIALRSPWDILDELKKGTLVRVLPACRGAADVGVYAIHRKERPTPPTVVAFIDHIRPAFEALSHPDVPEAIFSGPRS